MDNLIVFGARYLTSVMIVITLVYFFRQKREKRWRIFVFALISLPFIYLVGKLATLLYYNERPFAVGNFTPLVAHIADNGFPSEHTLLSAAIASIIYFFNKKLGTFLFLLAFLVGIARVLAGVHHVLDITGSIVIAATVSWMLHKWILPPVFGGKYFKSII